MDPARYHTALETIGSFRARNHDAGCLAGVGEALRRFRQANGESQTAVAARAGITRSMLWTYEQGNTYPSVETLGRVLDALGASLEDLADLLHTIQGRR